jgi:hypothetical protein
VTHRPGTTSTPRCRPLRFPLTLATILAALQAGTSTAQPLSGSEKSSRPSISAEFGFAGQFPGGRWGPITVHVGGGDEAFGGVIVTEFQQDLTQGTRIVTPFAATPGRTTPVQIVAALPEGCSEVRFSMLNERGRTLAEGTYASNPNDRTALLPPLLDGRTALLVTVGRASLNEAVHAWNRPGGLPGRPRLVRPDIASSPIRPDAAPTDNEIEASWRQVAGAVIQPDAMPVTPWAYNGVLLLIVGPDAAATAEPRAIEAVREWVAGGGRLVLLADTPGSAWRSWLPDGTAGDFINLAPAAALQMPSEIADAVRREGRPRTDERIDEEVVDAPPSEPMPAPATGITARAITITNRARADGWSLRWTIDEDRGLLAEGPVGFGWVTVLGMEPRGASSVLSSRAAGAVWREALTPAARDWLVQSAEAAHVSRSFFGQGPGRAALGAVIERVGDVPSAGDSLFYAIAAAMLALGLLVGPADYFLLRRLRADHRSWITALGWIGLASVAAYVIPIMFRSGPTLVSEVSVTDAFSGAPRGARTAVAGFYAAQSGRLRVLDPDQTSWSRGAALDIYYPGRNGPPTTSVTYVQDSAGQAAGGARGNPLEELPIGLWTFRTFVTDSYPECRLAASLEHADGAWVARVSGLPRGTIVTDAALQVAARWWLLNPEPKPGPAPEWNPRPGRIEIPYRAQPAARSGPDPNGRFDGPEWSARFAFNQDQPPDTWQPPGLTRNERLNPGALMESDRPGIPLDLSGPRERSPSIERRLQGRWAALYLSVKGHDPDLRVGWVNHSTAVGVIRLLTPLPETPP